MNGLFQDLACYQASLSHSVSPGLSLVDIDHDVECLDAHLVGPLDWSQKDRLQELLSRLVYRGGGVIRIEISGVTFISSVNLVAFFRVAGLLNECGRALELVGARANLIRVFDIARQVLGSDLFEDEAEQDAYFSALAVSA